MKSDNIKTIIFLIVILTIVVGGVFMLSNKKNTDGKAENLSVQSTVESQGKQVVEMTAKGGFSPSIVTAAANKDTILKVNTQNTFDCSSSISIPKLGVRQTLPFTGATNIEIAAQAPGTVIDGSCSMGMYHFQLKFV